MRTVKLLRLLTRSAAAFLFLVLALGSSAALAQDVCYVDTGGNDANNGLAASVSGGNGPNATIEGCLSEGYIGDGDIISIEAGEYNEAQVDVDLGVILEARETGLFDEVFIDNGVLISDDVIVRANTVAGSNPGVFVLGGDTPADALELTGGSLDIQDATGGGRVQIVDGGTVTREDETPITGDLAYQGAANVVYLDTDGDDTDVTAGVEIPDSFDGGSITVDLGAEENTLTLANGVTLMGGASVTVLGDDAISGTFVVEGDATFTGPGNVGTLDINDGAVVIGDAANIGVQSIDIANNNDISVTLGAGGSSTIVSVFGNFNRDGGAFDGANDELLFEAAGNAMLSSGPNFAVQTLTVDMDGSTLSISEDIDVTNSGGGNAFIVTNGSTVDIGGQTVNVTSDGLVDVDGSFVNLPTGGIVFEADGAVLQGDGTYGNIFIIAAAAADVDLGSNVEFANTLSLILGGINLNDFDLSPTGADASVVISTTDADNNIVNIDVDLNAATGTFNDADVEYDLEYTGDIDGTFTAGQEFNTANIRDLLFTTTDGTVDADAQAGGAISGDVTLTGVADDGNAVATDYTVLLPDGVTIEGMLTVGESTLLSSGAAIGLILQGADNTVNGMIDAVVTTTLDGDIALTGNANGDDFASSVGGLVVDGAVTVSNIQEIDGDLVTNADAALTLGLADEQSIDGLVDLNGASLTLASDVNVLEGAGANDVDISAGMLAFAGFDLVVNDDVVGAADVSYTSSGGALVFTNDAAGLNLNGETLPNLVVDGVVVTLGGAAEVSSSLSENDAGAIATGGNDLLVSGTFTSDGGTPISGAGSLTFNTTGITLSGDATLEPPTTVDADATVTLASNDDTDRTLTIDDNLTVDGTLAIGDNDVVVNGDLAGADGVVTSGEGFVSVGGGNIDADGTLAVPNLHIGAATVLGVTDNGTLTVSDMLILDGTLAENDDDDDLVIGNGATIEVAVALPLADEPTFEDAVNLVYDAATDTGEEVPDAGEGTVNNVTVNAAVETTQDITVGGTLELNAAIDNETNEDALTLAEGATLLLGIDNGTALASATISATNYNLTYGGPSDVISDDEFLPDATVNTVTIDLAAPANEIELDEERTLNNLTQVEGGFDMAGNQLNIAQSLTLADEEAFINSGADALLSFVGAADGMLMLTGNWEVPEEIGVEIAKEDTASVTLSGGDLDLRANSDAGDVIVLMLNGGQLDTADDVSVILYQDASSKGFVQGDPSSHVTGNVEKVLYAGDPFGTIPTGEPGAGASKAARFEFPVGAPNGEYRPAALTFSTSIPTRTDLVVRHENVSPGGTVGFPLQSNGTTIGNYPDFYWLMEASTSLGQAQLFDVELTGTQIGLPFENVDDLRIIRRFDGSATTNAWSVQGAATDYDNFLDVDEDGDTTAVVRVVESAGGLVPQGARFTLGIPTRAPGITFTDTSGAQVSLTNETDLTVNEGQTRVVELQYSALDIGEDATLAVDSLPAFATVDDAGDGTATLTLEPGFEDAGTHTAILSVTDPSGTTTITFDIVVVDTDQTIIVEDAPADTLQVPSNLITSFTITATDPEGEPLTFELVPADTLGATLETTDSTATFSITPDSTLIGDTLSFTINVSDGTNIVPVEFTLVVIEGQVVFGDVTQNGDVSAFDAAMVLRHVTGQITLNPVALAAGDVSGNGEVTAFDAALILQFSADIIACFPADPDCEEAGKSIVAATGDLAWGEVEAPVEGARIYVPVSLSGDVSNVYSVELTAAIDRELAEVTSVSGTKLPEGWQVAYAVDEAGQLKIAMAGAKPLANVGEIARIELELADEGAQVTITAEGNINENGVAFLGEIAAREIPTEFELGSNYPNPFNPTTTFTYSLPDNGKVMIQVFDITGRRVRLLVNEEKDAGVYKVQWDGRNDAGLQVASGMYLYQMRSGSFVDAKKMMLVK